MIIKINDYEFGIDSQLVNKALLPVKDEYMSKGWDCVLYLCGREGSGKTTLAGQIALYWDHAFNLDKVVFNGKQFIEAVNNAKKGDCILFDEAYDTFENKSAWKDEVRIIKSMLTRIRVKGLYLIIVAPVFFEMSPYITLHRSLFMIHIYNNKSDRGFYRLFIPEDRDNLYHMGYKFKDMYACQSSFYGCFTKFVPWDWDVYNIKKDKALQELIKKDDNLSDYNLGFLAGWRVGVGWVTNEYHISKDLIAEKLGITARTVQRWCKNIVMPVNVAESLDFVRENPENSDNDTATHIYNTYVSEEKEVKKEGL